MTDRSWRLAARWTASAVAAALLLTGCGQGSGAGVTADTTPVKGGVVRDAIVSDPPTLDWSYSTSTITFSIAWHIFEQLFALDRSYTVRPMLASGYQVSADGLAYVINLRSGVRFHNGSQMAAADVVASLKRWGEVSSIGRQAFGHVKSVEADGSQTVKVTMSSPFSPLIPDLAAFTQGCIVIPATVAEAAGKQPLNTDQLVGTGPYKFASWSHGQMVRLVRFDGYSSRSEDWGGVAGKKTGYADEIDFKVVPDAQQRMNALTAGEFDFATDLSPDSYAQLSSASNVKAIVTPPANMLYIVFNKARPPFNDLNLREAVNLVTDKQQIAAAAFGPKQFWQLDPGMFMPEQKLLYSNAGAADYRAHDSAKAKQLFQAAGYDANRPVRILVTKTYMYMYDGGVALAQELNQIGIKTELQVYDWPTDLARRKDQAGWDIFLTGFSEKFDPTQDFWITPTYAGWYDSPKMQKLLGGWAAATTDPERKQLMDQIQALQWQELPAIKVANQKALFAQRTALSGYHNYEEPRFWNDWLTKS